MRDIHLEHVAPADIEARSMAIIGEELGERTFPPAVSAFIEHARQALSGDSGGEIL